MDIHILSYSFFFIFFFLTKLCLKPTIKPWLQTSYVWNWWIFITRPFIKDDAFIISTARSWKYDINMCCQTSNWLNLQTLPRFYHNGKYSLSSFNCFANRQPYRGQSFNRSSMAKSSYQYHWIKEDQLIKRIICLTRPCPINCSVRLPTRTTTLIMVAFPIDVSIRNDTLFNLLSSQ